MNLPKRKLFLFLAFLFLIIPLIFPQKAQAAECAGDVPGQTCSPAGCLRQYGETGVPGLNWTCMSNQCCLNPVAVRKWFEPKPYLQYQQEIQENPQEIRAETWFQNFYSQMPNTLNYLVLGPIPPSGITSDYRPKGALGDVVNLLSLLYTNPPASGIEYFADLGRNFGIVSSAYAQQGIGFKYFVPILPVWKLSRNVAYLAFIIIFIVTGLAIMFRVKISPQAVLTIESALPKLIVALIAITFSYAIVGFLIDLIYILIGITIAILESQNLLVPPGKAASVFYNPGILTLLGEYFSSGKGFATMLGDSLGKAIYIPILSDIPVLGDKIEGGLITLVLVLALLFTCFKLFFSLLMCYIQIILGLITSPLVIMLSALPGKEGGAFGWLKDILANILVFPAVIALFLLADAIKNATQGVTQPLWSAPFLIPADAQLVGGLVSYGLLLLAPQIPSYVKALFEPKTKVAPPMAAVLGGAGAGVGLGRVGYEHLLGGEVAAAKKAALDTRAGQYQAGTGLKGKLGGVMRHLPGV